MIDKIKEEVKKLFSTAPAGHDYEHIERVYNTAMIIAEKEGADKEVVAISCLLHDADEAKLFGGIEEEYKNSRRIMNKFGVAAQKQQAILEIISNMGYRKTIKGIRPKSLEGRVVSDADMIDALGAIGLVRLITFMFERMGNECLFNKNIFPNLNLSYEEYKDINRAENNFINHLFEKLLKLKNMMMTDSGKKLAEERHQFMVSFLRQYFTELGLQNWLDYLDDYEKNNK